MRLHQNQYSKNVYASHSPYFEGSRCGKDSQLKAVSPGSRLPSAVTQRNKICSSHLGSSPKPANLGQIEGGTPVAFAAVRLRLESRESLARERGGIDPDEK